MEHVQQFFADPSTHCVGYGDRTTNSEASAGVPTDGIGVDVPATDAEVMPEIQEKHVADAAQAGTKAAHEVVGSEMARARALETDFGSSSPPVCPELLVREGDESWIRTYRRRAVSSWICT